MLAEAKDETSSNRIQYLCKPIEDCDFPQDSFDVVISSLALHYVPSFEHVVRTVKKCLVHNGDFVFSVEHPIFTAQGSQDWYYDQEGKSLHWPVDRYFTEGIRTAHFLGEDITKYHTTLTTYVNSLIQAGFEMTGLVEPQPEERMLRAVPAMGDELRRPMMLLVSAKKR